MNIKKLLGICLNLFDGGVAAGGDGAAAAGADAGAQGEVNGAVPGNTRRGKSDGPRAGKGAGSRNFVRNEHTGGEQVLYGKQPQEGDAGEGAAASDAGKQDNAGDVTVTSDTLEERRKAYRDLVNGEYKDIYTEDTQRIINARFKETKGLQDQVSQYQPIIDVLMQRYQIGDGDIGKLLSAVENDTAYWTKAAEEAGMGVEQFMNMKKMERENEALRRAERLRQGQENVDRQLAEWYQQGEAMKAQYPGFDFQAECQHPEFLNLLSRGVPVQTAYEVIHMDEIKQSVAQQTAQRTEKQVVDHIRAKGSRPQENGTAAQTAAFTVKDDVSKLTKKDREEIARRVARGEQISF